MSSKKRKCYVCGANLTDKQCCRVTENGVIRIVCPGKCAAKLSAFYLKEKKNANV